MLSRVRFALQKSSPLPVDNLRRASAIDIKAMLGDPKFGADAVARVAQERSGRPGSSLNPGDRRAIYALVRQLGVHDMLEVGTWVGSSTLFAAQALADNGGGHLTSVDIIDVNAPNGPWKQRGFERSPADALAVLGLRDLVTFRISDSVAYLMADPNSYDLIFLDGSHEPDCVYSELPLALDHLKPGGAVLLHDYYEDGKSLDPSGKAIPGPWMAMRRAMREQPALAVLPIRYLPWETKLGTRATSLALVARTC